MGKKTVISTSIIKNMKIFVLLLPSMDGDVN